jgi:hypothetical protein
MIKVNNECVAGRTANPVMSVEDCGISKMSDCRDRERGEGEAEKQKHRLRGMPAYSPSREEERL